MVPYMVRGRNSADHLVPSAVNTYCNRKNEVQLLTPLSWVFSKCNAIADRPYTHFAGIMVMCYDSSTAWGAGCHGGGLTCIVRPLLRRGGQGKYGDG